MKIRLSLVLVLLLGLLFTSQILAQEPSTGPAENAADLRTRLAEVQLRQADLQAQLNLLDEALKPENIEHSLAGVGSTRPEELREQRRRQLTIEKDGVTRQLDLLATSRTRLESAIQLADNRAYQQSAQGFSGNQVGFTPLYAVNPRRLVMICAVVFVVLGIGGLVALIRRQ
jgi:hypothetical protein